MLSLRHHDILWIAASLKHFMNQRLVHKQIVGQCRHWSDNHQVCKTCLTYSAAPQTVYGCAIKCLFMGEYLWLGV